MLAHKQLYKNTDGSNMSEWANFKQPFQVYWITVNSNLDGKLSHPTIADILNFQT